MQLIAASPMCSKAAGAQIMLPRKSFLGGMQPARDVAVSRPVRSSALTVKAERGGSFWSGFVVGGVVCGVLGFVFAPQISRALLGDEQRLRLPRFMEEEDLDPEVTKQNLADKIAQLNLAIDDVSAQLRSQEEPAEETA